MPVQDTLDSEYSGRYQVHSGASGGQLIISVTLTYGDVDMYVKMNGQATEFDYDFQDSSSFWADVDDDWWTMDDDDDYDDEDYTSMPKDKDGSLMMMMTMMMVITMKALGMRIHVV